MVLTVALSTSSRCLAVGRRILGYQLNTQRLFPQWDVTSIRNISNTTVMCQSHVKISTSLFSNSKIGLSDGASLNRRNYSTSEPEPEIPHKRSLPQLMSFPEIIWPSVLKSIKNWILIHFIIRPYLDNEFSIADFVAGTKHAMQVVSAKLASGEITSLKSLVHNDIIDELQKSVSNMSVAQRNEIKVIKDDIYLAFPYQIGIIFDESTEKIQKRWVEITMVFHVLRGLKEMRDNGIVPPLNLGVMPEYRDKISVCNYRFIKEFTQGVESDWTINVVNHFKPSDYIEQ